MQIKDSVEKLFRIGEEIVYAIIGVLLLFTAVIHIFHSSISLFHSISEKNLYRQRCM